MKPETYNRYIWPLKQLLPFKYKTEYIEDGKSYITKWRMWMGKCFHVQKWELE